MSFSGPTRATPVGRTPGHQPSDYQTVVVRLDDLNSEFFTLPQTATPAGQPIPAMVVTKSGERPYIGPPASLPYAVHNSRLQSGAGPLATGTLFATNWPAQVTQASQTLGLQMSPAEMADWLRWQDRPQSPSPAIQENWTRPARSDVQTATIGSITDWNEPMSRPVRQTPVPPVPSVPSDDTRFRQKYNQQRYGAISRVPGFTSYLKRYHAFGNQVSLITAPVSRWTRWLHPS